MLRLIVRLVLIVVVVLFAIVASRPDTYHVERSAVVAAPASVPFAAIVDFHRWSEWSPWDKLDPAMKTDFQGAAGEVGSSYHWVGNDKVGEGRMTIEEAVPGDHVRIRLEFIKPFASANTTLFTLAPEGAGTRVTWAMDGRHNLISKAMCLITPMDKMIGPDFEKGLASLQQVAMAAPASAPADSAAVAAH